MKVALYVRVSTNKQDADNQISVPKDFCIKSNLEIYKEYSDWKELSLNAYQKLFEIVLFYDLQQIQEKGANVLTLNKLSELEYNGIKWISYKEQYLDSCGDWKSVAIVTLLSSMR